MLYPSLSFRNGTWTPSDLASLLVWIDASDTSTVTESAGEVLSVTNKGSGSFTFSSSSTAGSRPTYTNTQNSKSIFTYTGVQVLVSDNNSSITGNPTFSTICVYKKSGTTNGSVFGWGSGGALNRVGIYDDGTFRNYAYGGANGFDILTTDAGWQIQAYVKTPGPIASTSASWRDGTINSTSGHSTNTPNIGLTPFYLGQWSDYTLGASRLIGDIAEFLVLEAALSTSDRQKAEGYLAHKWGIAGNLPVSHPYKNQAP